jgi:hypothetical protein
MNTIPAANGGFEVVCPGDPAELADAELLVLDFGRDANAWIAASSYAVCAADGDPFAPLLAKRLLATFARCRSFGENEAFLFEVFGGPPESSAPFEVLRRLAVKAPAPSPVSNTAPRARDGGPPTI